MSRPRSRSVLIALFVLAASGGLVLALRSHRYHHEHHEALVRKVADACTESALRVFEQHQSDASD